MTKAKAIIDELRRIRVSSKIAQFDLSEMSGYSRVTIARYEAGKHMPLHLQMLCNWAEALGHELVLVKKGSE